jgi:hypothetical protein
MCSWKYVDVNEIESIQAQRMASELLSRINLNDVCWLKGMRPMWWKSSGKMESGGRRDYVGDLTFSMNGFFGRSAHPDDKCYCLCPGICPPWTHLIAEA